MSAYYGMSMAYPTSRRVICHAVTVEEYTRTLPNGKTVTVKGYTRKGNAAIDLFRQQKNRQYNERASAYAKSGSSYARAAGRNVGNAVTSRKKDMTSRLADARFAGQNTARAVSNYAGYIGTRAEQAAYNARNWASDAGEVMQAAMGNFTEAVKYGAQVGAAYVQKAYEAGKAFIERLIGKVKEIAGTVGKAVGSAYSTASKAVGNAYNTASKAVGNAANTVGKYATDAYNSASKYVGNTVNSVRKRVTGR